MDYFSTGSWNRTNELLVQSEVQRPTTATPVCFLFSFVVVLKKRTDQITQASSWLSAFRVIGVEGIEPSTFVL